MAAKRLHICCALHTTDEHPFLTTDRGFVSAEDLRVGEQIRQLAGGYGVVVALQHIFGVAVRYNLTVQDDHTYAVGADQWVVHNTCGCGGSEAPEDNTLAGDNLSVSQEKDYHWEDDNAENHYNKHVIKRQEWGNPSSITLDQYKQRAIDLLSHKM